MSETITAERDLVGDHAAGPAGATRVPARLAGASRPEFLQDEILAEVFARTAAERPTATALRDPTRSLSYGEVDRRADAMARGLAARGLGPRKVAGLWMQRGLDLLIAQIAIAKTGAAWLPFDADAPADRVAVCLGDAEAVLLVTDGAFAAAHGAGMPCPAGDRGRTRVRRRGHRARRRAGRRDGAGRPRLSDLHVWLDRHAQGHRGHQPQHLPLPARRQRPLRDLGRRRGVPGRVGRLRPVDGGDLDPLSWSGASLFVATRDILGEADALPDVLNDARA